MSFKFYHHSKTKPKRVVILGTSGIISSNLQKALKKSKINVLLLGRSKLNLKKEIIPNGIHHIKFEIENPVSPLELFQSPDARKIGLLVESIEISID